MLLPQRGCSNSGTICSETLAVSPHHYAMISCLPWQMMDANFRSDLRFIRFAIIFRWHMLPSYLSFSVCSKSCLRLIVRYARDILFGYDGTHLTERIAHRFILITSARYNRFEKCAPGTSRTGSLACSLESTKFATGSTKMDITNSPSKDVQNILSTPREHKRLKVQHTADVGPI